MRDGSVRTVLLARTLSKSELKWPSNTVLFHWSNGRVFIISCKDHPSDHYSFTITWLTLHMITLFIEIHVDILGHTMAPLDGSVVSRYMIMSEWSPSGEWWAPHGAFESLGGDGWMGARQCLPHGGTSCVRGSSIGDTCWGRVWIGEFEVPSKSKKTLIGLGLVASSFNPLKESPTHQEHLSVYLNQNLEKEEHHGFHFRCNKQEEKKPRCFVIFFWTLSKLVLNE